MANEYSADVPKGFNVPKQVRLDSITAIQNEATLKNLGTGNNLAFKYYDGLKVRCKDEKTEYIWREVVGLEEGLLDTNFTYPTYPAVDGIDYSGKVYNFFELPSSNITPPDGSETKLVEGTNVTITGTGTTLDPYEISSSFETSQTYIKEGDNINLTGTGTEIDPFIINADLTDLGIVKTIDNEVTAPNQSLAIINEELTGKVLTTREYVQSVIPTIDISGKQDKILAKYKLLPSNFDFTTIPSGYDNTSWIIRYDFDLDNKSITLPENVTLSFEGGSITNGSIVLNNTTIDCKNIESVLADVVLTGTVTNASLDVRLFGILPNNNLIDTTVIYNTNLVGLDVILKFPKGNYYLSELHVTKNFFQIEGEESNDLEVRTVFHPFNASQYYIIKIGGTKFTLNNAASGWAKNSLIMHIWFTTPLDFTGLNLTSPDAAITNLAYQCSALILDKAQGGRYAINGHTLHNMPLLSIGQSYELYFDYIKMYANHGKSDLPIVQVTNNFQTGGYISATVIHQLWVESMVGSVFATSGLAGINELIINNVFIEGTIEWEQESIFTENRFTRLTKSLPSYYSTVENVIPMFYVGGVANITIGSMFINGTDTEWQNSLDPVPLGWNTRSFFKVDTVSSDIKIGGLSDGSYSQNMLLEGISSVAYRNTFRINNSSPEIAYYNQVADNFDFISGTNNIKPVKLKSNYEYVNDDLSFLLEAKFLTSIGLDNHFITPDEPAYTKAIRTRWDNYILNQSGFYVEDDNIKIVGKTSSGSNLIDIEYYDDSDTLLSTQNYSASVTPNVLFANTIALIKPVGYSYLKLVNANTGYFLNTYALNTLAKVNLISGILTALRVLVATGINTVKNSIIYDNDTSVSIATTGNPFLNILNLTSSEFINVGLTATEGIINSSRGIHFLTNNSTIPLKLDEEKVIVWYDPTTSASTYDILTRDIATGVIEKKPSSFFQKALTNYTVATLPTGTVGDMAYVTDAIAPTYLGTLTGGGVVTCPVFYNGSIWVSH